MWDEEQAPALLRFGHVFDGRMATRHALLVGVWLHTDLLRVSQDLFVKQKACLHAHLYLGGSWKDNQCEHEFPASNRCLQPKQETVFLFLFRRLLICPALLLADPPCG